MKQELNDTSKIVQDKLHAMDNTPLKKVVTHRFEPTSKYVLLSIGGLALSLVISIWGNLTQWRERQDWEEADLKYRALKMVLPSDDPNVRYIESHNMTWQETCLIWFHIWILLFHSVSYILFKFYDPIILIISKGTCIWNNDVRHVWLICITILSNKTILDYNFNT